ncbi:MAG TPA: hypothetical protein VGM86_29980 [Thermoanaerobaculia bacterium]
MIYTSPDQDWSYCMWECGVALLPESPDTRIILFRCSGTSPALFAEQVNVNARDLVSVQQFVDDFLTSPDFFPGSSGPITKFQPHGREVANAAADLFQKLQPILPPEKEDCSIEWPAQPFFQLQLGFDFVEQILKADNKDRKQLGSKVVLKESRISAADKYCEQMFGVPSFQEGTTFGQLVSIWKERHPDADSKWVQALCAQILAAVLWKFPPVTWELMQGLSDEIWRAPMLTRVHKHPALRHMQFDICFHRFDLKAGAESIEINIPKPVTRGKKKREPASSGGRSRKPRSADPAEPAR